MTAPPPQFGIFLWPGLLVLPPCSQKDKRDFGALMLNAKLIDVEGADTLQVFAAESVTQHQYFTTFLFMCEDNSSWTS